MHELHLVSAYIHAYKYGICYKCISNAYISVWLATTGDLRIKDTLVKPLLSLVWRLFLWETKKVLDLYIYREEIY